MSVFRCRSIAFPSISRDNIQKENTPHIRDACSAVPLCLKRRRGPSFRSGAITERPARTTQGPGPFRPRGSRAHFGRRRPGGFQSMAAIPCGAPRAVYSSRSKPCFTHMVPSPGAFVKAYGVKNYALRLLQLSLRLSCSAGELSPAETTP